MIVYWKKNILILNYFIKTINVQREIEKIRKKNRKNYLQEKISVLKFECKYIILIQHNYYKFFI